MPRPARPQTAGEFARRLRQMLADRGWNQSELARRATRQMPEGMVLGRDVVSHWINRPAIPEPVRLQAVARALGVSENDLVPPAGLPQSAQPTKVSSEDSSMEMKVDAHDRRMVWLKLNRRMSFEAALKIQQLVLDEDKREENGFAVSDR